MVRLNSYLAGISDTDFKVIFTNRYAMEQAERNAASFIDAMAAETGKTLKMVATFAEPEEAAQQSFLGEEVPVSQIVDLGADAASSEGNAGGGSADAASSEGNVSGGSDDAASSEGNAGAGNSNAANNTVGAGESNGAAEGDGNTESDDASDFDSLSDEELEAIARELEADFDVKARIE